MPERGDAIPGQGDWPQLPALVELMRAAGLSPASIGGFCRLYRRYRGGDLGTVSWSEVAPVGVGDVVDHRALRDGPNEQRGRALLGALVCIKLNGGLGTTMNLDRAKSLIAVRGGRSFLELSLAQVESRRTARGGRPALLLLNSERTRADSLPVIEQAGATQPDRLPWDFLQPVYPRLDGQSGQAACLPESESSWAPAGHGDCYLSLREGGLLDALLACGYRWAFVSNVDNLAATVDPSLLGYLDREGIEFALEVTEKTAADRKGGVIVRRGGRLALLEQAQLPAEQAVAFDDAASPPLFNTNSVWWNLPALQRRLAAGPLDLPLIVNHKQVAGADIVQLETAMGAAVGCFERAAAIRVGRERFAPVKATDDLLVVRSDAFVIDPEDGGLRPNPARDPELGPVIVRLDEAYYRGVDQLEQRFGSTPSLVRCASLEIEGDVHFGPDIELRGRVVLRNRSGRPQRIAGGALLADQTVEWPA
ncbi:MAG: UTP--glucose-1-phosphate uridylyltransferase [Proteobacteria bacterium]|nr:UTP--glucose-1-phosphate uridylyltransferase [Pseudomonadota bacterium]